MGRIRILSDTVANKIAAGEVVERPASVVKELLENSLDAGATRMRIDIESGGRRLIRIADDGCGMLRDDAMLAFERHATSKLSDVKDLLSIATLGFRGEALPSIASVSRLVLETRSDDETVGAKVEIAGGKLLKCDDAALVAGTIISVRDLFFNVPARKKFLRSDQTELAHIASLATHYSLAHCGKSFQLFHEGKELLAVSPVESLQERVYQVFGRRILDDLIDLGEREREGFRLKGFISNPQVQKMNRNSIFLFVNGRLIRDRLLLHAISAAYYNLMPPACYPFALLFLECDPEEVDVNVHPSKTEVRFHRSSVVHDFVRDALRETLIASRPISSLPIPVSSQPVTWQAAQSDGLPHEAETLASAALPEFALRATQAPAPRFDFGDGSTAIPPMPPSPAASKLTVPDTHGPLLENLAEPDHSLSALSDLRPLGQIHESFIVAAGRDGLWIIDQHVAHERILFERILKQRAAGRVEMQQLLMPIVLELSASQQIEYARIADELHAIGFESEPFGHRTVAVKAAPAGVGPSQIEKLIFEILEIAESDLRKVSLDDLRRGIAASIACRAAIKINMRLEPSKMEWLLSALAATDCPMSCPHGRPIALRYSTKDILKSFHRI